MPLTYNERRLTEALTVYGLTPRDTHRALISLPDHNRVEHCPICGVTVYPAGPVVSRLCQSCAS